MAWVMGVSLAAKNPIEENGDEAAPRQPQLPVQQYRRVDRMLHRLAALHAQFCPFSATKDRRVRRPEDRVPEDALVNGTGRLVVVTVETVKRRPLREGRITLAKTCRSWSLASSRFLRSRVCFFSSAMWHFHSIHATSEQRAMSTRRLRVASDGTLLLLDTSPLTCV